MLVVGQGALARPDGGQVLALTAKLAVDSGMVKEGWNGFCVLHTAASRVGGGTFGFPVVDMIEVSERTRSGKMIAISCAIMPPMEAPT